MSGILGFFQDNIIVSIVLGLILLYVLYRSPKLFFIVLFIAILLSGIYYVISDVASIGGHQKKKMIQERDVP
jgi:cell shape-determining protein MreC